MTDTASRPATGRAQPGRLAAWRYILTTTNPPAGARLDPVGRWLVISRAAVLPMTVFAGLVALLLAVRVPGFSPVDWTLAFIGIVAAHVANNLMNDVFDTRVGGDTATYPRALYAPHPILSGLTTRRRLSAAILVVNVVDLGILAYLTSQRGWPILAFGLGGFLLSIAYTAPPLRLKKRGLGEPDVLVTWGPLMVGGTYFASVGAIPWQIWLASIPYGVLCTTVLMGKHVDKIPYDAPDGTRTLPVIFGSAPARAVTLGLMVAFYVLVAVAAGVGAYPLTALIALLALPRLIKIWPYYRNPPPTEPPKRFPVWPLWYAAIAFVHVRLAGALLVVGLAIGAAAGLH